MKIRFIRTLLFGLILLCMSAASFAQIGVMITFGPPPIPVYEQPICPGDGYIWTPGYWAYGDDFGDYYWVPGTWVEAPEVGFLWTPGYWGWSGDRFAFTEGYWGPQVGFYGGINYGFGYFGDGYQGGRWENNHFFYNRSVTRVNVTVIHNVYNTKVVERTSTRVSFNGGNGGVNVRPSPREEAATRERHVPPVSAQAQHMQAARSNNNLRASINRGKPDIAATDKPGDFNGRDVVRAKKAGGKYTPPPAAANRGGNQPRENAATPRPDNNNRPENNNAGKNNNNAPQSGRPVHAGDLPAATRPNAPNTGDAKRDQKIQQQQEKQSAKQDQERQKLQQRQQQEDQKAAKNANDARKQQVEQRHEQQTQKLQQRHEQQQQKLQQRAQPASRPEPKPKK